DCARLVRPSRLRTVGRGRAEDLDFVAILEIDAAVGGHLPLAARRAVPLDVQAAVGEDGRRREVAAGLDRLDVRKPIGGAELVLYQRRVVHEGGGRRAL